VCVCVGGGANGREGPDAAQDVSKKDKKIRDRIVQVQK